MIDVVYISSGSDLSPADKWVSVTCAHGGKVFVTVSDKAQEVTLHKYDTEPATLDEAQLRATKYAEELGLAQIYVVGFADA